MSYLSAIMSPRFSYSKKLEVVQ